MKKFMILMVAMTMMATFALTGCGNKQDNSTTSEVYGEIPEEVSSTDTNDDENSATVSSSDDESSDDSEEPAKNVSSGTIEDIPALTIELKDGKTFKYNGECFADVYQQLCDLGIEKEKNNGEYSEKGLFKSDYIEASNGTKFTIKYIPESKTFTVRTDEGYKLGTDRTPSTWNFECGPIDNEMLISDFVKMGATAVEEKNEHSDGTNITAYYLESANFASKGVSVSASGDGSPQESDLVVRQITVTYSGVEA